MQFLWKYIDDLMGKGLDFGTIAEMMLYACASLVPMALPLAVLLSSIMTMGKLGELNELVAMKASGMSLWKILKPLTGFILVLTFATYLFANYVWPEANLKFRVLVNDIADSKATLLLKEGEYISDFEGYRIKIDKKLDENNLKGVHISEFKTHYYGNDRREIFADRAKISKDPTGNFLILRLFDGESHETLPPKSMENAKAPYRKTYFHEAAITLDLASFKLHRSNFNEFKDRVEILNHQQLSEAIDSIENHKIEMVKNGVDVSKNRLLFFRDSTYVNWAEVKAMDPTKDIDLGSYKSVLNRAQIAAAQVEKDVKYKMNAFVEPDEYIKHMKIAWHRIFSLCYSVFVLYLIGAPLGAVVRKGGIGMPVLFAVIIFIVYFMISRTGENMVKTDSLEPFMGLWLAPICLTPFAVFLFIKASGESAIFKKETYLRWFKKKAQPE